MTMLFGLNPNGMSMSYRLECLSEEDVIHLAAGLVPPQLRSQCMALLDFDAMLQRNAQKPVKRQPVTKKRSA